MGEEAAALGREYMETALVELAGGRSIVVRAFRAAETGGLQRVTLALAWTDDASLEPADRTLAIPGRAVPRLVEALQQLEGGERHA